MGGEPLNALQHGKFFNGNVYIPNLTPVRIFRRYMLFGLVPEGVGVGLAFLKFCRPNWSLHLRDATRGIVYSTCQVPLTITSVPFLAFENSMVHIEFQGSRLHRRAARLIPDEHEYIHFAQLRASWNTAMAFCDLTSFLQCGRTPHDTNFQHTPTMFFCDATMYRLFMTIQMHLSHTLVECETRFMRLGCCRPQYDVNFSTKGR